MKTMEMIMQALEDSTVNIIGIYGAGGVGKTALVKEVAKKAQEKKLFNMVLMANITKNPDIKKIQGQIAEMLGMRLTEESGIVRADRIRKRLKKEKENILIILDDLWCGLDLNRLGIPCRDDDDGSQWDVSDVFDFGNNMMGKEKLSVDFNKMEKEESVDFNKMEKEELSVDFNKMGKEELSGDHNGCKILLTSRRKQVICNQMDVKESSTFSVGVLDENEAKTLLKKVAGIHVQNLVFDEKAIEIAKMCDGLPIALVSIGRTLKNKSSFVWEDVCQQIKRQSFTKGQESIEFSVKLSYDHLENEQLKSIFLHCARMGNDALVIDLMKLCIGLGLLQGVHTIREAKKRVNMLITELKESSLLVESYSSDRFNMHDIVRDVSLSISSKEKQVFFMKNGILDEWPHEDELERYTVIFLHCCDITDELPESIYCPRLEVLHIDGKNESLEIPDNFFKDMIRVRVLVLTGFNLPCLPSSIKCLKKLRMLSLERCTLGKNLSIIGELKKLRILTLSGSNMESLPLEFGQLDKLQLFDLSNCSKLRVIPSNIISRMNSLEEFLMRDILIQWEAEDEVQSENASLSELKHLNQLRTLDIRIQSVARFPQTLFFDKLDSYKIVIGEFNVRSMGEFKVPDKYEGVKFLALNLKEGFDIHSERWVKMLFRSVEYLFLGELNDVHDVFYELNVEGFQNLKHLSIVKNFGIQYIINSVGRFHPLLAFSKLKSLCLYKLDNLEKICDNQLAEGSFSKLKIMKIKACDKLENLFPFSMVKLLTKLETIEVCDCDSLKEIFSVERQTHTISDDKIEFPQLRHLTLKSLPEFTSLYTNDKMPCSAQSLEDHVPNRNKDIITEVEQGPTNSCLSIFNEKVSIPKLECLELSSINIQKIWSDQSQHCFQNLLTLNVTDCGNLKYLLSFSMAESLVNLQSLFISACEMMEDIFNPEDAEQNIDVFPTLKKMEIICMEKLNTIWQPHIGLHSFSCLDSLIIKECHKLVMIFPSYMGQRFQSLQSLNITNCKLVEFIFDFGNIPLTCDRNETNLHNVFLKELPNLVHVWKDDTSEIHKYNNLHSIAVKGCPNLKYLLPLSVANDLEKLEILDILKCGGMKEIVAWDEGSNENAMITFKFPHLKEVALQLSFELVSFYRGTHTLEWPSLENLTIFKCSKLLEGLTTEIRNSQAKPIILAIEKVIYNLEFMAMSLKEAEWFQKHVVSVHRMNKLQRLVLIQLKNTEILFWFLRRLSNLRSLLLGSCPLKRIWAPASLISCEKIGVVMQLKELELHGMWSLEKIGFEHDPLLERLECLVIHRCMKLINLAPSSVSYSYITHLEVMHCRSMKNLMTSSTAKTLVQLTTMKVGFCPMIVEIVAENEVEKEQEIEFRQLKSLELVSLQNLTSFCSSEKCGLKFPLLENFVMSECPKMTKFSKVQSAPNLQKVHVVPGEKEKWYWEGDLNVTLQKHFKDQVSLEYSKQVKLIDYPETKGVWNDKPFPDNFFGCLKKLEFDKASKRNIVIPYHVLPYLKTLEELNVHNCDKVQVIFDMDDSETKGIVFRLKRLTLSDLSNLKCVWNKSPGGIVSFFNLQHVDVEDCRSLASLFPLSLARKLGKLGTLDITHCEKMVEIVGKEDTMEHETTEMFEFPCLSSLTLWDMSELSCFYPGKHHLKCPILQSLHVSYCPKLKVFRSEFNDSHKAVSQLHQPLFFVEKVAPQLKQLSVNEENIILLGDEHLPQDILCKLISLQLHLDEENKKDTLPFDFLHTVPSLEQLKVRRCYGLKEIFPSQKLHVHDGILAQLKQFELIQLNELESIGLEHPWVKPYSQKLQILTLYGCFKLEKLVHYAVSFINLKELEVSDCVSMECLFSFSTAKSLVQLKKLTIENCESLKEIVKKEDEDVSHEIKFGCLTTLTMDSLPKLVRFYSGNVTLQFSCLETATISECPNMNTFSGGIVNAPMFYGIQTSTEDSDLIFHDNLNMTIEMLFHQEEFFEYTKHMILLDYFEMTGVRIGKPVFLDNFFGSFKKLEFDGATKRDIIIPCHVLSYLKTLEELNVHSCDKAHVIFDIDDREAKTKEIILPLKKLTLEDLSNLKCVWNKNPTGIVSFPNLQQVTLIGCRRLATLFPLSIATNLGKLETLVIWKCDKLVEIVGKKDAMEHGTIKIFEFCCLWELVLYKLPLLNCFYPGNHQVECPRLQNLDVSYCPELKLFTSSEFHNSYKEADLEKPLFLVEKVVSNLKELTLNEENIILLSDTHLPQDFLCKIKIIDLSFDDHDNKKDILPFDFLHKVPNLECLRVQRCYGLKEIFPFQKLQVHDGILVRLNELCLFKLKDLESIGLDHPWVKPYSGKIEILKIAKCSRLENLVCSAVCFINLKWLVVKLCERMEYLFTFSTAKSLVQLKILQVENCKSIKEIVRKEDEDASHEIIFGRLRTLTLDSLPRLVKFYSGNATLQFSCLEEATITKCPKLNTFSEGVISTSMFEGIKTSMKDSDLTFHDDLNTTINWLFHQQVENVEPLKFDDHPRLEEIWLRVILIPNCFNNLTSLSLVGCESLCNGIPFYLLRFLCNLKEIKVSNCQSVEAIFDVKVTGPDTKSASRIFFPLKKLILNQLPNLEHIWNLNPDEILGRQDLHEVYISNCQSLKSLFPSSVINHLVMLDVRSCAKLIEIFVEDEAALKGETKQFIFHCLTSLRLWGLSELKSFYPENHSLEWPMLTHLDVYHCDKLKLFTTEHHSGEVADIEEVGISIDQQAIFIVEKVFPNLVQLSLKKEDTMGISQEQFQVMPSLEDQAITCKDNMIGQGQFSANAAYLLKNLKVLKLMCYHEDDESNIFSSGVLEKIPNFESLEVFCSSFNEIFSSQRPSIDCTNNVLSKLKRLHLKSLRQLNSIGLEHSWVEPLLKTLETLEVFSCPSMKILVPSIVSFSNLTSLNVGECNGLVYLFTSSTAKGLGQLKHMSIRDCQAIKEIVSNEGDHEFNDEEITFEQLSVLSLESLPNIVGVYSGTFKLKFPSLDQVTLMECPQMKYSYVVDLHQFKPFEHIELGEQKF